MPRFSNPTGEVYDAATVDRIAALGKHAHKDFRIFWDDAYAVHAFDAAAPTLPAWLVLIRMKRVCMNDEASTGLAPVKIKPLSPSASPGGPALFLPQRLLQNLPVAHTIQKPCPPPICIP